MAAYLKRTNDVDVEDEQMKEQKLPLIKLESNRIKKEKTFQFDDDDDEDVGMDGGMGMLPASPTLLAASSPFDNN